MANSTTPNFQSIEKEFRIEVQDAVKNTRTQAQRRTIRAANELRNAALNVLRGQRHGRTYRKPFTKAEYRASAPREPPAVRTGVLRISWGIKAEGKGGGKFTAGIYTRVPYAEMLEEGTGHAEPRPYREKIIERARPNIRRIFGEINK
ncbi:MAG: HK97 gp10 family phage protein [Ruminococcus sp.]